jgi:hypothetical protein
VTEAIIILATGSRTQVGTPQVTDTFFFYNAANAALPWRSAAFFEKTGEDFYGVIHGQGQEFGAVSAFTKGVIF